MQFQEQEKRFREELDKRFQEQEKRFREELDKRFQEQETIWKKMFLVMEEKQSAFEVKNSNRNAQIVTLETKTDELETKLKTKTEELETKLKTKTDELETKLKTQTTVELETLKTKTEALEAKIKCSEMHIEELKSNIEDDRNKQKQEMAELQMRTARLEAKDAVLAERFEKAMDKGNGEAMFQLALCYEQGKGVLKNEARAAELYQEAADKGNVEAMFQLARCYEHGKGVIQSQAKAAKWFEKSHLAK
uniref:Sel1 repeat protein n=1 Tax=Palpitomonas bilix TaxID=652834 RepID=A0A7S3D6T8_9EUKA|mmetsp:Transcript_24605/g.62280  ORF Transcript_24605/g.62280 Transcript_24605/m.62280 type:complete len:249 (+) Transcript_24605:1246-1992(+)|eukprot:CAMPEP_0113869578 /NCGR_PEP_ID=MMETSP0780_2-20120614/1613_1 /TAXON_ID=652834 /ORGANISM="Palpitomonas bilix" /LENGTH=248 /DNA_ID=CAMNT_0000854769 /DNA_START=2123 /DNA_END=2869 /DNA_ORIENTATION=- /assembly_acc=CAM_ASM_000599